jgi:hypothetical protein
VRAFLNSSMDQSVESVFYQNVVILLLSSITYYAVVRVDKIIYGSWFI